MKKLLPLLLLLGILTAFVVLPAFAADPPFSVKVVGMVDKTTPYAGKDTLAVDWKIMANQANLVLYSDQVLNLAYDSTILQPIRWDATGAINTSAWGQKLQSIFPIDADDNMVYAPGIFCPGVYSSININDNIKFSGAKSTTDSNICYLSMELGDFFETYNCTAGQLVSLGQIRFTFQTGKSAADLVPGSIRLLNAQELAGIQQGVSARITIKAGNNDATYTYGAQQGGVFVGGDELEAPVIELPKAILYGDVNGDGIVNPMDVTRLLRYFSGADSSTNNFNEANADANGDGILNPMDVTRLLRYFSGADPSPLGPKVLPEGLSMSAFASYAADNPVIKVSEVTGKPGDEVTLTVTLEDNPGIPAFYLTMQYDKNKLTYVPASATAGEIITTNFAAIESDTSVAISAATSSGTDSTTGSVIFSIKFKINEGVGAGIIDGDALKLFYTYGGIESKEQWCVWDILQGKIAVDTPPNANPVIALSEATGKPGDEVTLTATLVDNPGIPAFYLTMQYDKNKLTYVPASATAGDIITANFAAIDSGTSVAISAATSSGTDSTTGSVIFSIKFKINEGVGAGIIDGDALKLFYTYGGIESKEQWCVWDISQGKITVEAPDTPTLDGIAVTTPPTKTEYFVGETLNLNGMVVTATYSDKSTKPVTGYTTNPAAGATLNTPGSIPVNITYTEEGVTKEASQTILVKPIEVESIKVTTQPTKTTYFVGETLNLSGMVVTATYNNGSTAPVTGYTTNPANGATLNTASSITVTVYYEGKQDSFSVTVTAVAVDSIKVTTQPTKATYFVGETLNLGGMVVTAYYNNETSAPVTGYTANPANGATLNTAGSIPVTVTYEGKQDTFNVTVTAIVVESIKVTTPPIKIAYFVGDTLNLSGMVVTAYYNNDTSAVVTGYTANPANGATLNTAGSIPVSITFEGKQDSFNVTVTAVVVESIKVTTPPTKTAYLVGDTLNLSGMVVTATYNNGISEPVTGYTTSPANGAALNTAGQIPVTVTYQSKQDVFDVTVGTVEVVSIAVTTPPTKTTYFVGDTLDLNGMVVTAYFNNDTSAAVTGYTTSPAAGATLNTAGSIPVTVTYASKQASFNVTVTAVVVESIKVTTPPTKTVYLVGDTLDLSGMVVTATYNNGSTAPVTGYTASPANGAALNTAGSIPVTVTFESKQDSFNVTVGNVEVVSIAVTTPPTKTTYFVGDTLNLAGMVVTAYYNNDTSAPVTGYTTSPAAGATLNTAGSIPVTVTFEGKQASFNVTVNAVVLTSIKVTTPPTKTVYLVGDTLDLSGMVVTAYYNNDTSTAVTGYTTSPANGAALNTAGQIPVTVTYQSQQDVFDVTVGSVEVVSIAVTTPPTKTTYFVGDTLDLSGMVVTAYFNNDTSAPVTGYTANPANGAVLNTAGSIPVAVTYASKQASFNVTVNAVELTSIAVTTPPTKIAYFVGDTLDLSGMVVTATYNNGSTAPVTGYTTTPANGAVLSTVGPIPVTVTYEGKQDSFELALANPEVESIKVTTIPTKTVYQVGDTLDLSGIVVTAYYSNDTSAVVTGYTANPAHGATLNTAGQVPVTVGLAGKQDSFTVTVTVVAVELVRIEVTTPPTKTAYFVGDTLNLAGMVVTAFYSNDTSEAVTAYTTDPAAGAVLNTAGPGSVGVSYGGKSTSFNITVTAVVLEKIDVTIKPAKLEYNLGNALDLSGMYVTATYNNGSKPVTGYTTVPANGTVLNAVGPVTVTVSYSEGDVTKTDSFAVSVIDAQVAPTITGPTSMSLTVGYATTSTGEYTVTGSPVPTVTKTSGNAAITWNNNTKKLDIAAGLAVGSYPVVLTVDNGVTPNATLTFTLTVNEVMQSNYNVYLTPQKTNLTVGETLYVDVVLVGNINYTQMAADIGYDASLLKFAGYEGLQGFISACGPVGDKIGLRSVPTSNMILGGSCSSATTIVTLKFTVTDNFAGESISTKLSVSSAIVNPPAGYLGTTTAPGQDWNFTLNK